MTNGEIKQIFPYPKEINKLLEERTELKSLLEYITAQLDALDNRIRKLERK